MKDEAGREKKTNQNGDQFQNKKKRAGRRGCVGNVSPDIFLCYTGMFFKHPLLFPLCAFFCFFSLGHAGRAHFILKGCKSQKDPGFVVRLAQRCFPCLLNEITFGDEGKRLNAKRATAPRESR